MIPRLRHWWQETRSSFWFMPAAIVLGAVGLAISLIALDTHVDLDANKKWPLIFGSGAAGARGLLSTVAGSMITVAGVVFSITIVALSLTSSQYTSRILRNFMSDRMNQAVLGVFVGIFAYCLVVLRTIRGGDEGAFVPSLAVLGGLALAFVGIGYLILFIHHISISIQASSIIAAAAQETNAAINHLFPNELGENADDGAEDRIAPLPDAQTWTAIKSLSTGYIESIDGDALLAWAREHDTVLRMERGIGEFVIEGTPLVSVVGPDAADAESAAQLNATYFISRQRTVHQDAGYGIRQIVDIAMKALSPGVNDTTTAVMCIDYLGAILTRLAPRGIATPYRLDHGSLRVIARGPTFVSLLAEAFDQIRQNASGNAAVLLRLIQSLETIASQTTNAHRRAALLQQVNLISAIAEDTIDLPQDGAGVKAAAKRICVVLESPLRRES